MRCVIFDLDGTLADTAADLIAAANACFAGMGAAVRLDPKADASFGLRGGRAMLTEGLRREGAADDGVIDAWYPRLLDAYGDALHVHTTLFPDAEATVRALRSEGYATGICTNKPAALAERLVAALGVRDLFDTLIGADTLPVRKPDPAPFWAAVDGAGGRRDACLLVGDTDTDRKTATAASVPCVLVDFTHDREVLDTFKAEAVIDGFAALPDAVRRLIG